MCQNSRSLYGKCLAKYGDRESHAENGTTLPYFYPLCKILLPLRILQYQFRISDT
jgi:hypothetical protein